MKMNQSLRTPVFAKSINRQVTTGSISDGVTPSDFWDDVKRVVKGGVRAW